MTESTLNNDTEDTTAATSAFEARLKQLADLEAYYSIDLEMTQVRHRKSPKSWFRIGRFWINTVRKEVEPEVHTETMKVHKLPSSSCSKCYGRGHKGLFTDAKGNSKFIACQCVMKD